MVSLLDSEQLPRVMPGFVRRLGCGRAALYLRVSTERRTGPVESGPTSAATGLLPGEGIEVVEEFVESGASATDDRRPEFQRMMDAASQKPQRSTRLSSTLSPRSVST